MAFPLDLQDPSLWLADLGLLLAISSGALLVASDLLLDWIGSSRVRLDKRRLRNAGFVVAILFLATIALRIWMLERGLLFPMST